MSAQTSVQKQMLRREVRERLAKLTPAMRLQAGNRATAILRSQQTWNKAHTIIFYAPMPDEVDLTAMLNEALAAGKTVALPGYVSEAATYRAFIIKDFAKDCVPGKFGILEPKPTCPSLALNALDLALVPGVAFDLSGRRLGRGQGFYDRLLALASGIKCGVSFDEQIVHEIPVEPHDAHMNCLLTPSRWLAMAG